MVFRATEEPGNWGAGPYSLQMGYYSDLTHSAISYLLAPFRVLPSIHLMSG